MSRLPLALTLAAWLPVAAALAAQDGPLPGSPAPPQVVAAIQQTLDAAVSSFDAMDASLEVDRGLGAHAAEDAHPLHRGAVSRTFRAATTSGVSDAHPASWARRTS